MIDPENIILFEADEPHLQEFLLFGIMVAGKPARRTAKLLDTLLKDIPGAGDPFQKIASIKNIKEFLKNTVQGNIQN